MFDDCLIMAGGSGTRLWPASSSRLPKQFLPAGNGSFFSMALERALAATAPAAGRVIVIAGTKHIPHVITDAAKLTAAEKKRLVVIEEPAAKNTAPAIGCALVFSILKSKNRKMLVLTSDHIIKPLNAFLSDAALAASAAEKDQLAVFGIPPTRPETGYGYIAVNSEQLAMSSEKGEGKRELFKVSSFCEKPDLITAKKYLSAKKYFWNSGMFAFNTEFMIQQFKTFAPDVLIPFEKLKDPKKEAYTVSRGIKILNNWQGLKAAYNKAKSISFDYAIAEKCRDTVMVRTTFDWTDIGNWEDYIKICEKNNSVVFSADSKNCHVDSDIPVALAGVEDLIIVMRSGKNGQPACALVTRKGQAHKVRDVAEMIKNSGENGLL